MPDTAGAIAERQAAYAVEGVPPTVALRSRPTVAVSLVYASSAVVWGSYALLVVALPFRFQSLGLSVVQYGVAVAALSSGMLVTESVWGVLAFRIGNLRTVLALGAAVILVYVAVLLSNNFLALTVSLGLLGALVIFQVPLMRWVALTALGPGTGGRGTGIYGLFFGAGLVAGTTLGPLLFVEYGFSDLLFIVIATYGVGLAMMVALPWSQVTLPSRQPGFVRHLRGVMTRPFLLAAVLVALALLCRSMMTNFLQYYSVSVFGGTPSEAGYVIGAAQAVVLVAGALLGVIVDRWGPGRSTPFGFGLLVIGAFGTWLSSSYPEMVGATLVLAAGTGWLAASLLPLALGPVPLRLQGTAVGVFGSFEDLGLLVGPLLLSTVYAAYGASSMFLVTGTVALVGTFLSALLAQRDGRSRLKSGFAVALHE